MQQATYRKRPDEFIQVGYRAHVETIQHPTHPHTEVMTSTVQSHDKETGVFSTKNTTYTPHKEQ